MNVDYGCEQILSEYNSDKIRDRVISERNLDGDGWCEKH